MPDSDPFAKLPSRHRQTKPTPAQSAQAQGHAARETEHGPKADKTPNSGALSDITGTHSTHHPVKLHAHGPHRETAKAILVHPLENALLIAVAIHLIFLPWALGTMRIWAQLISLTLSTLTFGLALLPRHYTPDHTGGSPYRYLPSRKLVRFPIFWLGLALLGLIVCQGLNPAWEYQTNGKGWWMRAIPHTTWLPHGVRVPFEIYGPWRVLIIYASTLLTVCSVWIGLTRRRTIQRLFIALVLNSTVLAIFGIIQKASGSWKMFGAIESPNSNFFASFIYKNHAGAYLLVSATLSCILAAWYYVRGEARMEKSNPAVIFALTTLIAAAAIIASYARGATLTLFAFLVFACAGFIYHQFVASPKGKRIPVIAITLLLLSAAALKPGLNAIDSREALSRLRSGLVGANDHSLTSRLAATRASRDMLMDYWTTGTGAGAFRFLFPAYQQHYPEILYHPNGQRQFWHHAHNDWLQLPVELGIPGLLIICLSFAYWVRTLVQNSLFRRPYALVGVAGLALVALYSYWDFPFQNPSILLTWCAIWAALAIWTHAENGHVSANRPSQSVGKSGE